MKTFVHHFALLLLITVFSSSILNAQDYLPLAPADPTATNKLPDLEKAFWDWSQQHNLDETKGWKYYYRWLHEELKRSNLNGDVADKTPLMRAAVEVTRLKQQTSNASRNGNWMPLGPDVLPEVPGNDLLRGMGRINTIAFHPTDANTFWIGVAQGGLWKTTDGGSSWLPLTDDLPILRISDIALDPNDSDVMYISVGDYAYLGFSLETAERKRNTHYGLGVYKTVDGGQTWNPTGLTFNLTDLDGSLTRRVFVNPNNSNQLVAAGIHGIWQSEDAGDTWTQSYEEMIWDIEQDPISPNILYASTAFVANLNAGTAGIIKSTDFGATWTVLSTGIPEENVVQRIELAIAPSQPNRVYAITCDMFGGMHGLYRSDNSGDSWLFIPVNTNILHWTTGLNGGGQGTYDLAITVDPNDPDKIYAGGVNMWGSTDGGDSWQVATYWRPDYGPSIHADQHFFKFNPIDGQLYVCNDGGIYRTSQVELTTWDMLLNGPDTTLNTQWEDLSGGMAITSFYRMDVSPSNIDFLVAGSQDNSVMIQNDNGWSNVVIGDGMDCFFHPEDANIIYASTQFGRFVRTENGGLNFTPTLTGQIRTIESGEWTTPFVQDPIEPNTIYTAFGNVWRSFNRGDSWERLTDLPLLENVPGANFSAPSSAFTLAPSDPSTFYVAKRIYPTFGEPGHLYRGEDDGATVIEITDGLPDSLFISSIAVSHQNPQEVWVTLAGFAEGVKVFKSFDGGDNWENISFNLPNIPVNAIYHQSSEAHNTVYIGTDIGIYYLDDLEDEWQLYSNLLPNVIVTDLKIIPEENRIYASTFGRGLWVSDLAQASDPSSSGEVFQKMQIQLGPNPNQGQFALSIQDAPQDDLLLEVVDIKGQLKYQQAIQLSSGQWQENLQLDLPYGMYFLRVSDGIYGKVIRFTVQ